MAAPQPIQAGNGLLPAKTDNNGETDKAGNGYTTITAFVTVNGQPGSTFMLTCGHSFRDADPNKTRNMGAANNYIGIVPAGVAAIPHADQICWAMKLGRDFQPSAMSYLQYHCPGDKIGSNFDGGLAQVIAGVPYSNVNQFTINAFDAHLPPDNDPATSDLYLDEKRFLTTHRDRLIFRPNFQTNDNLTYHNVYIVRTDEPENTLQDAISWQGLSGTPLYRVARGALPNQNPPAPATVIAYFCSRATEAPVGGAAGAMYYVFQCMGEPVQRLNITGIAP